MGYWLFRLLDASRDFSEEANLVVSVLVSIAVGIAVPGLRERSFVAAAFLVMLGMQILRFDSSTALQEKEIHESVNIFLLRHGSVIG